MEVRWPMPVPRAASSLPSSRSSSVRRRPNQAPPTWATFSPRVIRASSASTRSSSSTSPGAPAPLLFTGDALFAGGTGRCDQPGASRPLADTSLREMLETLPPEAVVLPGHGGVTTVGQERHRHAVSDPTLAA